MTGTVETSSISAAFLDLNGRGEMTSIVPRRLWSPAAYLQDINTFAVDCCAFTERRW